MRHQLHAHLPVLQGRKKSEFESTLFAVVLLLLIRSETCSMYRCTLFLIHVFLFFFVFLQVAEFSGANPETLEQKLNELK